MIFRLSHKLASKIKVGHLTDLPLAENPYADWSAHVFSADRTQYILLTNTKSLYSAVMYGKGVVNQQHFAQHALENLREVMTHDDLVEVFERYIAPAHTEVSFGKTLNRAVTGSMNDLIRSATVYLEDQLSLRETSIRLTQTPMSAIGTGSNLGFPRDVFLAMNKKITARSAADRGTQRKANPRS
jgi:hypothetical protein